MAEMSGDDLFREINKLNLGVKTYVLTGDDGLILALNCFGMGCSRIFIKPAKRQELAETVESIEQEFANWRQVFKNLQERKKVQKTS